LEPRARHVRALWRFVVRLRVGAPTQPPRPLRIEPRTANRLKPCSRAIPSHGAAHGARFPTSRGGPLAARAHASTPRAPPQSRDRGHRPVVALALLLVRARRDHHHRPSRRSGRAPVGRVPAGPYGGGRSLSLEMATGALPGDASRERPPPKGSGRDPLVVRRRL